MNEILKAMMTRRSIRKFKPDLPGKEALKQIAEAGLYAASGKGKQAPVVIAVTDKDLLGRLSAANRKIMGAPENMDPFYGAPAVFIVLSDRSVPTYVYDGSLVIGNMMLAAHSLGLGSVWIHRARQEFEEEEFKALLVKLGIDGDYEGIGHCAVGYMDCELPPVPPRKEGRLYWVE